MSRRKTAAATIATKGIIMREGRVLILQRSHTQSCPGSWEFPGGKLEYGETPPEGLAREIMEEAGLSATVGRIAYVASFRRRATQRVVILLTYYCQADEGTVRLSDEHTSFCWAARAEAEALLQPSILKDLKHEGVWEALPLG